METPECIDINGFEGAIQLAVCSCIQFDPIHPPRQWRRHRGPEPAAGTAGAALRELIEAPDGLRAALLGLRPSRPSRYSHPHSLFFAVSFAAPLAASAASGHYLDVRAPPHAPLPTSRSCLTPPSAFRTASASPNLPSVPPFSLSL